MSMNNGKNIAVLGAGAALLGGLLAAFGGGAKPKRPNMSGAPAPKKKPCNCGR